MDYVWFCIKLRVIGSYWKVRTQIVARRIEIDGIMRAEKSEFFIVYNSIDKLIVIRLGN